MLGESPNLCSVFRICLTKTLAHLTPASAPFTRGCEKFTPLARRCVCAKSTDASPTPSSFPETASQMYISHRATGNHTKVTATSERQCFPALIVVSNIFPCFRNFERRHPVLQQQPAVPGEHDPVGGLAVRGGRAGLLPRRRHRLQAQMYDAEPGAALLHHPLLLCRHFLFSCC